MMSSVILVYLTMTWLKVLLRDIQFNTFTPFPCPIFCPSFLRF